MPEVTLYNREGKEVGSVAFPESVFGVQPSVPLIHRAVLAEEANSRQGTADTKKRGEIRGGGRKPWRQKGTGRARQGSTRAPHWRHGGVVFGPQPRSYRLGIPKKMRQLAKKSALNARAREGALFVVDALEYEKPKTKTLAELLAKLGV